MDTPKILPAVYHMDGQANILQVLRALALAVHLMLAPAFSGISIAGDEPTAEPTTTLAPAPAQVTEPTGADLNIEKSAIGKTADKAHEGIERGILENVIRLDNFFGNDTAENPQKAEYQIRWRNSIRVDDDGNLQLGSTLWANIHLSKINERLHLVVTEEDEPEPISLGLPQDPGNPGFDRNTQSTHSTNSELRYDLFKTPSLEIFLGAGIRFMIPVEGFVRCRSQYKYKISDVLLLHCSETLFAKDYNLFGETSEIVLERMFNRETLLRWSGTGTISSEIAGMEWGTELSLIRILSPQRGITFTGGVYGISSYNDPVENYRILARYRQNFLRSWLFYELEPEVSWPRQTDGTFPTAYAFTFRIEVVFQGKEK